jgi:hypothetical protein
MMTSPTTSSTKTTPALEVPAAAQQIREQVLSGVSQVQQVSLDAARGWVKAVSALPVSELPKISGVPTVANIGAVSTFAFDFAADLLNAQRDYALQFVEVLAPAKAV